MVWGIFPIWLAAKNFNKSAVKHDTNLQTAIDFALDLALKKYDGQKVWLIYSIKSNNSLG